MIFTSDITSSLNERRNFYPWILSISTNQIDQIFESSSFDQKSIKMLGLDNWKSISKIVGNNRNPSTSDDIKLLDIRLLLLFSSESEFERSLEFWMAQFLFSDEESFKLFFSKYPSSNNCVFFLERFLLLFLK